MPRENIIMATAAQIKFSMHRHIAISPCLEHYKRLNDQFKHVHKT